MESRAAPKRRRVRRLDSIQLNKNDKTYFTDEGYLVDHPILTSIGIFEYTNPDGSIRRELRLPKYVFAEESLKSYKGKPVIITHEAGVVNKENVDEEQIGTILSEGYEDGDNVRAEIIIHNADAMQKCGLRELSLGYNLDLLEEPGEWNGQSYDAIQTNIMINHLALVTNARAGEQARLNIDGSDGPIQKGGKSKMAKATQNNSGVMTPEELAKAVEAYRIRKAERTANGEEKTTTSETDSEEELEETISVTEEEMLDGEEEETATKESTGSTPAEITKMVKDRRDRRDSEEDPKNLKGAMGVIAQQDEDIDMLLACLEKFFAEEKAKENQEEEECKEDSEEEEKVDSTENKAKSLNADSADRLFRQRLSICRIGDKLRMDGLEQKSILEGKKAIVAKVLPSMRLDGKSKAYIDAAYDLAVGEVNKRKTIAYQKQQMTQNQNPWANRTDGKENVSMAASARQRMLERQEGGKEEWQHR